MLGDTVTIHRRWTKLPRKRAARERRAAALLRKYGKDVSAARTYALAKACELRGSGNEAEECKAQELEAAAELLYDQAAIDRLREGDGLAAE